MKKYFKSSLLLVAFAAMSVGFWQCATSIEEINKDLQIVVKNDLIRIATTIQIVDVNPNANIPSFGPDKFEVEVSGPDADLIYTPSIEKIASVKSFQGGILDIATKSNARPSIQKPLRFTLTIRASGYLPVVQNFDIRDTVHRLYTVPVLNPNDPPKGVTVSTKTVKVDASGVTTAVTSNLNDLTVTLPKGTVCKTANGVPVTGDLTFQVIHFSPETEEVANLLPSLNLKGTNNILSPFSYGFVSYNLFAGNNVVKYFENGELSVNMNLAKGSVNELGVAVKPGDVAKLYSTDEFSKVWELEGDVTIAGTASAPSANWKQNHLSTWRLSSSDSPSSCTVKVKIPSTLPNGNYKLDLFDKENRKESYGETRLLLQPLQEMTFVNTISGLKYIRLTPDFIKTNIQAPKTPIFTELFDICNFDGKTLVLKGVPEKNNNPEVTFKVLGYCPENPTLLVGPTMIVWYRPAGADDKSWKVLGSSVNGYMKTNLMAVQTKYDFMIFNGRETHIIPNSLLAEKHQQLPADIPKEYLYELKPVPMPAFICNFF